MAKHCSTYLIDFLQIFQNRFALLSHFISTCRLTIPDAEHGTSSKIRSNAILSHHAFLLSRGFAITCAFNSNLSKFSLILVVRKILFSKAVKFTL